MKSHRSTLLSLDDVSLWDRTCERTETDVSPKVYIILVNFNGWKDTVECLESVLRSDYPDFQVIVVDNASKDRSLEQIAAWARGREDARAANPRLAGLIRPPIEKPVECSCYASEILSDSASLPPDDGNRPLILISSGENRGFAAGNNIGISYALAKNDASFIWLLNNDTVIEAGTLTALVNKARTYEKEGRKVGMIGAKLMYYDFPDRIQGVAGLYNKWFARSKHLGMFEEDRGQYDDENIALRMDYPIGASLFVPVDFIRDVGLMCEDYFLYFEELDWAVRGRAKGWQLGYCWQARVFHKEGSSAGADTRKPREKSAIADFHSIRNRIVFTKKFFPAQLPTVRLGLLFVLLNRIRRGQFDRLEWVISESILPNE